MQKFQTTSAKQTQKIAKELAENIIRLNSPTYNLVPLTSKALVVALKGDLGAGKTTFTQGFLRGLGVKSKITSPTFVLMKTYNLQPATCNKFKKAVHIDCYRLQSSKDILNLGFKELISDPQNILLIEWPERISRLLKQDSSKTAEGISENKISIVLRHGKTLSERIIEIK